MEISGGGGYGDMLEKYRDVDEDALMADMTEEELLQLENEINREVLEAVPSIDYGDSDESYSSSEDEEEPKTLLEKYLPVIEKRKELRRQQSLQHDEPKVEDLAGSKKSLKPVTNEKHADKYKKSNKFEIPELKKTEKNNTKLKNKEDDKSEALRNELIETVKQREVKKRIKRANSGADRRNSIGRRPSFGIKPKPKRNPKVTRHASGNERLMGGVNNNFATSEMNALRSKLKKVTVKEPKLVLPDELHGVSFDRITAGVKNKNLEEEDDNERYANSDDGDTSRNSAYDADNDVTPSVSDGSSVVVCDDEDDKFTMNKAISICSESPSEEVVAFAASSEAAEPIDMLSEMAINPNSVEEMLNRIQENDPELTEVNLNNIHNVPMETFQELVDGLNTNNYVKSLQIANTGLTDVVCTNIAKMLKRNQTLTQLNIESNFITGAGATKVVSALRKNNTLTELKIDNQRHIFGAKTEFEFAKVLKENKSVVKFGYHFAQAGPRMTAHGAISKNMDLVRKKRLADKKAGKDKPPRPPLKRQPSSEWYRKEKADRIRALQEECKKIASEPEGKGKLRQSPPPYPINIFGQDKKVETMLQNMKPEEVSLLEQWFAAKLLGKMDKPPQAEHERIKAEEEAAKKEAMRKEVEKDKLEHPRAKALRTPKTGRRSPSPNPGAQREQLLDSIRNRGVKLRKVNSPCRSPYLTDASDSESELVRPKKASSSASVPPPQPLIAKQNNQSISAEVKNDPIKNNEIPTIMKTQPSVDESVKSPDILKKSNTDILSPSTESMTHASSTPEEREWKEGEHYDSDEYDIVEVEVSASESEDEAAENFDTFHIREPLKPRIMSDNEDSGMQTISEDDVDDRSQKNFDKNSGKNREFAIIAQDEGVSIRTPSPDKRNNLKLKNPRDLALQSHSSPSPKAEIYGHLDTKLSSQNRSSDSLHKTPTSPRSPYSFKSSSSKFSDRSPLSGSPLNSPSPLRSPLSKFSSSSPSYNRTISTGSSDSGRSDYLSKLKPSSPITYQRPGSPNTVKICPKAYSAVDSFFK